MRAKRLITAAAVAATLAAAPTAQAVNRPTLDRINDSMVASFGVRLPIRYLPLPSDRIAQLSWSVEGGYSVDLDASRRAADAYDTCQSVAHEYTHWMRRNQEAAWLAALPPDASAKDIQAAFHQNWPQDESQPYAPCRDLAQLRARAERLDLWLWSAAPLSWRDCRTRGTARARRICAQRVDAKWRHRRQVRTELRRANLLLGR